MKNQPVVGSIDTAIPISLTEGVRWPALPSADAIMCLAVAQQLDDSQWWSVGQLAKQQNEQLAELLAYAAHAVPFYRLRLQDAGFRPDVRFTREIWDRVPILTLDELRAAGDAPLSRAVPPQHGGISAGAIDGPDGRTLQFAETALSIRLAEAFDLREAQWDSRVLSGKLAVVAPAAAAPPIPEDLDDWGSPFRETFVTGPRVFCAAELPAAEQAAWLEREQPDLLVGAPERIGALAALFRDEGRKLASLRHVRTVGAMASGALRSACRDAWGVKLHDSYRSVLAGPLSYPCPNSEHHHVHVERVLLEIVDASGNPCRPEHSGRVVVTPLHNLALPLIRLDIGARAAFGSPCPCGRGLPVLAIEGFSSLR